MPSGGIETQLAGKFTPKRSSDISAASFLRKPLRRCRTFSLNRTEPGTVGGVLFSMDPLDDMKEQRATSSSWLTVKIGPVACSGVIPAARDGGRAFREQRRRRRGNLTCLPAPNGSRFASSWAFIPLAAVWRARSTSERADRAHQRKTGEGRAMPPAEAGRIGTYVERRCH